MLEMSETFSFQICAQTRTLCQLLGSLLEPLPRPQLPWSHLAIDFLTDHPNSQGYATILVIIGFLKHVASSHSRDYPQLRKLLLPYFSMCSGCATSPRTLFLTGVQFTLRVWRAFCDHLNIIVRLTSGLISVFNLVCCCAV